MQSTNNQSVEKLLVPILHLLRADASNSEVRRAQAAIQRGEKGQFAIGGSLSRFRAQRR
jgi:hypothetical protein